MPGKLIPVGTRVKPSQYALRHKRDEVTKYLKGYPQRARAERWYEEAAAKRGTIVEHLAPQQGFNVSTSPGYRVSWDGGSESRCLAYMVEVA